MTRHTARISRTGLILIGLILLAGGGAALARSLGAFPAVLGRSTAPLLSHAQTRYPTGHAWVWPVAAAAAAVIALLALWWLAAQTRTHTVRRLSLEPDRTGGVTVLPARRSHRRDHRRTRKLPRHPAGQRRPARIPGSAPAATVSHRRRPRRPRHRAHPHRNRGPRPPAHRPRT